MQYSAKTCFCTMSTRAGFNSNKAEPHFMRFTFASNLYRSLEPGQKLEGVFADLHCGKQYHQKGGGHESQALHEKGVVARVGTGTPVEPRITGHRKSTMATMARLMFAAEGLPKHYRIDANDAGLGISYCAQCSVGRAQPGCRIHLLMQRHAKGTLEYFLLALAARL